MSEINPSSIFKVWAIDNVVYGPVDLPVLMTWVQEERVTPETWIYIEHKESWRKASEIKELQPAFHQVAANNIASSQSLAETDFASVDLKPGALRQIKAFANFGEEQLRRIEEYLVFNPVPQWAVVVKQGDPGDAMYMILEGEVRVRLMIAGKETIIATLAAGEFFGELCLFDHGPRSADVVANADSLLLKMSASAFHKLMTVEPELGSPFLLAVCKTMSARIRADNKRLRDAIRFSRVTH